MGNDKENIKIMAFTWSDVFTVYTLLIYTQTHIYMIHTIHTSIHTIISSFSFVLLWFFLCVTFFLCLFYGIKCKNEKILHENERESERSVLNENEKVNVEAWKEETRRTTITTRSERKSCEIACLLLYPNLRYRTTTTRNKLSEPNLALKMSENRIQDEIRYLRIVVFK